MGAKHNFQFHRFMFQQLKTLNSAVKIFSSALFILAEIKNKQNYKLSKCQAADYLSDKL